MHFRVMAAPGDGQGEREAVVAASALVRFFLVWRTFGRGLPRAGLPVNGLQATACGLQTSISHATAHPLPLSYPAVHCGRPEGHGMPGDGH